MSILCFGEILWDCLPAGLFLGGAPFNVAAHLAQLGKTPVLVSALGDDQFGEEIRRRMRMLELDDTFVSQAEAATGSVLVELQNGQPSYTIVDQVAYDQITDSDRLYQAAADSEAIVFGSLAQRHQANQETLARVRAHCTGMHVFDVNLRAPWVPDAWLQETLATVDLIKLNDDEISVLGSCDSTALADQAQAFSQQYGNTRVCLTAGAKGAGLWWQGEWYWADAPTVIVKDAVGAGDSFLAALLAGLLDQQAPQTCLEHCVRLAAHVAASDGATPAHPTG